MRDRGAQKELEAACSFDPIKSKLHEGAVNVCPSLKPLTLPWTAIVSKCFEFFLAPPAIFNACGQMTTALLAGAGARHDNKANQSARA